MTASYVQVAPDSTGKKLNTRQRTVGTNTVQDLYVINANDGVLVNGLYAGAALFSGVQSAHNGTSTGFGWVVNPVGSGVLVGLFELDLRAQMNANTATASVQTQINLARFSYTGTPTGASLTLAKKDSTHPTPKATFYTASTGMTITGLVDINAWLSPTNLTTTSNVSNTRAQGPLLESDMECDDIDSMIVLREGEGFVFYQPNAGVATDPRVYQINATLLEYTVP